MRTQAEFEQYVKRVQELAAFAKKLEAAADIFAKAKWGQGHSTSAYVAKCIVEKFGDTPAAVDCMDYVLQQMVTAGAVCETYTAYLAQDHVWNELKQHLQAGTAFKFGPTKPNQEFRRHLAVVP